MTGRVVYEYDPATGQTVATELPDDLFSLAPEAVEVSNSGAKVVQGVTPSPSAPGSVLLGPGNERQLNASGKEKVKTFVARARTLEELAEIDAALDTGRLNAGLAERLNLCEADFVPLGSPGGVPPPPVRGTHAGQQSPPVAVAAHLAPQPPHTKTAAHVAQQATPLGALSTAAPPAGALGLTSSGLFKVRHAIQAATNMVLLATLDKALTQGDIPKLQELLTLGPEDLQGEEHEADAASEGHASTEPSDTDAEDDEEYDPFATEPESIATEASKPAPKTAAKSKATTAAKSKAHVSGGALGSLQSEYDDSDGEQAAPALKSTAATEARLPAERPLKKRRRGGAQREAAEQVEEKLKTLEWPLEWAWLVSRTQRHPDFRQPTLIADTRWAKDPAEEGAAPALQRIVSIATSMIYVGDSAYGYDPRHLARVTTVDERGRVLLDAIIKPRATVLDYRTHLTGLSKESFEEGALDFETLISQLLEIIQPKTLLIGHRLNSDLEALHLWHGPVIDVSLLFGVEGRKQHQYHSLRYIAEVILGEEVEEDAPHDPLEAARQALKLAQHEAKQAEQTRPFPPKPGNSCELAVRHIPIEWRAEAETRVAALCPGALRATCVNWLLSEVDPTDWRGDTVLAFASASARDMAFEALQGLTDVHIQWQDLPGAPPLGAFLTEQALIKAFSQFGVVVSARIPRKPTTREPQSFAFVSYQAREDAERVARRQSIEVQLTPTWTLPLRPRLAKFGQASDKRVAIQVRTDDDDEDDQFAPLDWVHVFRR